MIWGEHAEKYSELLKEEAKCLLFTLGNHTYHHKDLTKLSIKEGKNDEVIEKITGQQPEVIRPPFGSVNADVLSYLNRPTIIWSLDIKKLGSS
ncbi:polysaccharide deacetylase [Limosilactobacillus reuteri subsp. rodentium]|uniref:Polysaccharide deacetylase n=2 Tax=Limosilactobacillus reuteri TaxID=1598 RepID=B3XR22_LIMR1|nr:polysaccharide deacetylase [Limosilactobacillus reuteri subsp. rodentium]